MSWFKKDMEPLEADEDMLFTSEETQPYWILTLTRRERVALRIDVLAGRILDLDIGDTPPNDIPAAVLTCQKQISDMCDQLCEITGLETDESEER